MIRTFNSIGFYQGKWGVYFVLLLIPVLTDANRYQEDWGFYGHQKINRLAVFTLPVEMIPFYKHHIQYITEKSVNPDKRRYAVPDEAPRHYIDLDKYGDSAWVWLPRYWQDAVTLLTEDTLKKHGIVPWHIFRVKNQLTTAFRERDPERILRLSADLGHYIGDAHVPLHTTSNYNGQFTGQYGIHGFWESRLPELFSENYDLFTGKATYLEKPQLAAWDAVISAHKALDSVLLFEKELSERLPADQKYAIEQRGTVAMKVYAYDFSRKYHERLSGMVERQMRSAIKMTGDFWFTAWVDAGQPDLTSLVKVQVKDTVVYVQKQPTYMVNHESGDPVEN